MFAYLSIPNRVDKNKCKVGEDNVGTERVKRTVKVIIIK